MAVITWLTTGVVVLFPLVSATAGGFVCIIGFISLVIVLGLVLGLLTVGSSASCSEGAVAFGLLCVSSWSSSPVRVVCCGWEPDLFLGLYPSEELSQICWLDSCHGFGL